MKKRILSFIVVAVLVLVPLGALASQYESNVTVMPGGTDKTAAKKFTKGQFRIVYDVDTIFDDSLPKKALFALTKNELFGTKIKQVEEAPTTFHTRVNVVYGDYSAGTYYYQIAAKSNAFGVSGNNEAYAGFIGRLGQIS